MPHTIKYDRIEKSLSSARIATYQKFFTAHTEQEIYGIYLWNKLLGAALYPILQAAEIALRNTINQAAISKFGNYWYGTVKHHPRSPKKDNYSYINFQSNFERARIKIVKRLNKNLPKNKKLQPSHQPDFNMVVAETDFSTWEYALHPVFYKTGDKNFIWPLLSKKAFKNWPHQSSKNTHTVLYDLVSEIRPFRNRLSHHEPLWKGAKVKTEQDALAFINKKIDAIEQLIAIISSEKLKYLNTQKLIEKVRFIATKEMLDRCRYRVKGRQLSFRRKRKMKRFWIELHDSKRSEIVIIAGKKFLVEPFI